MAQYADACNVFGGPVAIHRKYEILRRHCEAVGRDPDEIERTTLQDARPSTGGERPAESAQRLVDRVGELADSGAQHVILAIRDAWRLDGLEIIGRDVIPVVRDL